MKTNLRSKDAIQLINPWSGAQPPDAVYTWSDIVAFCREYIHPIDHKEWIAEARRAARNDDGKTLGIMIIGS